MLGRNFFWIVGMESEILQSNIVTPPNSQSDQNSMLSAIQRHEKTEIDFAMKG